MLKIHFETNKNHWFGKIRDFFKRLQIIQHSGLTFGLYSCLFDMIFSPEGVVSSEDYEYQIKAVCKMVSNRDHAFGAAEIQGPLSG